MDSRDGTRADVDLVGRAELEALVACGPGPCVSMFLPTHRVSEATRQDRLRLKNLTARAATELVAQGMRRPDVEQLLAPARDLHDDALFWRHQADGLALFITEGRSRAYRVPISLDEELVVASTFHLRPLLPLLVGDGHFFVLALSQNRVQLYEGTRFTLGAVGVPGMPTSIDEALAHEDPERQLQFHSASGPSGGPTFHGHGLGDEFDKAAIERFLQAVERALGPALAGRRDPLVLAGVEYYGPIFRSVTKYPHVTEGMVTGSADRIGAVEVHERAWELVEPRFAEQREAALRTYAELAGTGRATDQMEEAVLAAVTGRVEAAFVASGIQVWGRVELDDASVIVSPERADGDTELLDLAAVRTYLSSGEVYVMPVDEVPGGGPLAAVLRY